ncbi:MAG TPA: ABC transporter permease, partial [Verrucomicrobiota bacterium]|nr:ABC transporter permease [Verrucomicrobiota bacterium]
MRTLLAVPIATAVALAVHLAVARNEPPTDTRTFTIFLALIGGLSIAAAGLQFASTALQRWMAHMCPILAAAVLSLCAWEIITTGLR